MENLEKELMEIESLLNDFNHEIAEYISDAQFDEESFAQVEARLDTLNHLKSKYGGTVEEILFSVCSTHRFHNFSSIGKTPVLLL